MNSHKQHVPGTQMPGIFLSPNIGTGHTTIFQNGGNDYGSRSGDNVLHKGKALAWGGTMVLEAPDSRTALKLAGLDWNVIQKPIKTQDVPLSGQANLRDTDSRILGVVTDRYRVVQNQEAFAFTDGLLGEGVRYETAGSLQDGRRTWLLAKLPQRFIISGDEVIPYLVFMNSHDGTGSIKVARRPYVWYA